VGKTGEVMLEVGGQKKSSGKRDLLNACKETRLNRREGLSRRLKKRKGNPNFNTRYCKTKRGLRREREEEAD